MGLARLFLAIVVALAHWRANGLEPYRLDNISGAFTLGFHAGYAVMFFYVVSGFLITYTLTVNYSADSRGWLRFYRGRFVRIFSVYWPIAIAIFVLIPGTFAAFAEADILDQFTKIFIFGQDWRIPFAEYPNPHFAATFLFLEPSWTLGAELTFYLLAPLLLRSWQTAVAILILSFCARAAFVLVVGDMQSHPIWTYQFAATTIGFFLLGHLACRAGFRWPALRAPKVALYLVPACVVVMMFASHRGFDSPRFWISILCFTIALPSLFEATKDARWLNFLGCLSYPLYLLHRPLIELTRDTIVPSFGGPGASTVIFLAFAVLASTLIHSAIERPTARAMTFAINVLANVIRQFSSAVQAGMRPNGSGETERTPV